MVSRAVKVLVYLVTAVLIFFGLIFVISVKLGFSYLVNGLILFIVAGVLLLAVRRKKPLQ